MTVIKDIWDYLSLILLTAKSICFLNEQNKQAYLVDNSSDVTLKTVGENIHWFFLEW